MSTPVPQFVRGRTKRLAERASVQVDATMVTMSAYRFPELVDISRTGAKLKGPPLPKKGTSALLRAGALEVLCGVVWVNEAHCGIRFDEPVSPRILKQVQLNGSATLETRRDDPATPTDGSR